MTKISRVNLFCVFSLFLLASSKFPVDTAVRIPYITEGKSKIAGLITGLSPTNKDSVFVNITVPHPISGDYVQYKAFVDKSGKFSTSVDVETDISLVALNTSLNQEKSLLVKVQSKGTTIVNIAYHSNFDIKNIDVTPHMSYYDMTQGLEVIGKMIEYRPNKAPEPLYNKSTDDFLNYAKTVVYKRLEILDNDSLVSNDLKDVLSKDFRLFMYRGHVFDYEGEMRINYRNTNDNKSEAPAMPKIDRTYFRFLKDFKLNDPQYLLCFEFLKFQKEILQNEVLALPVIGETDIPTWLAQVKVILSDLVGFNNGPYYDILVANAYARQLNEEIRPLSEKQKNNILNYWKNGEIAKILIRKNQQIVELNKVKSVAVVNDISSVPGDKVIETILSKHKNKVVLFDLWATWCAPCLEAMQRFRTTKADFADKNVEFVYLTNASSPRKLWEEKIKGIGDEHYYLTDSQWEYIMNRFGFDAIPSYLLYNKEGVLKNKFTAFPKNEKVKGMINDLL